jgi:hypothetical protein
MLVTYTDIRKALNIDLTDPNGQSLATSLINTAVAYAEAQVGHPLEEATVTGYFDGEFNRLWLHTAAPVSNLVITTYNRSNGEYEALDPGYIRHTGNNQVYLGVSLPYGFQSVQATYTIGWTAQTLPADLKQAFIEVVRLKLQAVTNFSGNPDDPTGDGSGAAAGSLKRVSSGAYSEEYGSTGSEVMWKAKAAQLWRIR